MSLAIPCKHDRCLTDAETGESVCLGCGMVRVVEGSVDDVRYGLSREKRQRLRELETLDMKGKLSAEDAKEFHALKNRPKYIAVQPEKRFKTTSRRMILDVNMPKGRKKRVVMLNPEELRSITADEAEVIEAQIARIRKNIPDYKAPKSTVYQRVGDERAFKKMIEDSPFGEAAIEVAEGRLRLVDPKFAGSRKQSAAEQLLEQYYRGKR